MNPHPAPKPPQKILVGITEIAGYAQYLSQGFTEISQDNVCIILYPSPQFKIPPTPYFWINLAQKIGQKATLTPKKNFIQKLFWKALRLVAKLAILVWALGEIDVFVFTFGRSFFSWDLWLFKVLKKKSIFILNGSDSRPPYLNAKFDGLSPQKLFKETQKIKNRVTHLEKYATALIAISHQGYFHQKQLYMGLAIGQPSAIVPQVHHRTDPTAPVRIFHSSTHFLLKGTGYIRKCIETLQRKGHHIDYIEVQNTPHDEALKLMASADIIIDQIYSDMPLSMQCIEGLFLEKPVIVCGYYAEHIQSDIPAQFIPPNIFCVPEQLTEAIEDLMIHPDKRKALGHQALYYARSHLNNAEIAKRFLHIIDGTAPKEWAYTPQDNRYLEGIGYPREKLKKNLKTYVSKMGLKALCLEDKPALQKKFQDFLTHTSK